MELHVKVMVCGTNVYMINSVGEIMNISRFPVNEKAIKIWLYFACVIFHPTVMFRKSIFATDKCLYKKQQAEDYELWTRICQKYNIRNLRGALLKRRIHSNNSICLNKQEMYQKTVEIQKRIWNSMGIPIDISIPFYETGELTPKEIRKRIKYINELEQKIPCFIGKKQIFHDIRKAIIPNEY